MLILSLLAVLLFIRACMSADKWLALYWFFVALYWILNWGRSR